MQPDFVPQPCPSVEGESYKFDMHPVRLLLQGAGLHNQAEMARAGTSLSPTTRMMFLISAVKLHIRRRDANGCLSLGIVEVCSRSIQRQRNC